MRELWRALVLTICLLFPTAAYAQTPIPPPTSTPMPLCPPGLEDKCEWGKNTFDAYGIWLVIALLLIGLAYVLIKNYAQGSLDFLKKVGESRLDKTFKRLEISATTRQYLEKVSKTYTRFKFRGLPRTVAKGIKPPELDQAYISVRILPESKGSTERTKVKEGPELGGMGRMETSKPMDLAGVLQKSNTRKLAIIGIAGSGKSTLLQWAGLACARANLGQKLVKEQEEFIQTLDGKAPLPFLVPLLAYNEYCKNNKARRSTKSLLDFMAWYFSQNQSDCTFDVEFFKKNLSQPCLLMFDGVDEVNPDDRAEVRSAIESLLADFNHPRMYCLITTRPSASYVPDQMSGFRHCDVQRLTPKQRDDLIQFWHEAVYAENQTEAKKKAGELIVRIGASSQSVRNLATTPLMVTIFCMVSYSHELPRLRARLYEDAVEVLLTETTFKEGEENRGLDEWGGVDPETRRDRLAFIAFELQEKCVEKMLESDLVDLIWNKFGTEEDAAREESHRFLQVVAQRGGLLEAMDDEYGFFTHATFREYLAGRYLAEEMTEEWESFLPDHAFDDQWEESIRLAAGYLSIKGQNKSDRFINLLMQLGVDNSRHASAVTLAGLSLSDIRTDRRLPETAKALSQEMLTSLTANPPVAYTPVRLRLGLTLVEIGDPRFVMDKETKAILPHLVAIPAGNFRMGTSEEDVKIIEKQKAKIWDDEKPAHEVFLSEYAIGKYPVTNAEFRCFWEQGGYKSNARWWGEAGHKWRIGAKPDREWLSKGEREAWLAQRPVKRRDRPFWWDDPKWNAANLPVVGITWFEAEAYCNWLSEVTSRNFRLPTEAEWEQAARGDKNFIWSWGNEWDAERANTSEAEKKIGGTTPVGMYPHGASSYEVQDMIGNVWEWCLDWYNENEYKEREGKEVKDPCRVDGTAHVLRGGSWDGARNLERCSVRGKNGPDDFNYDVGFRVVCSPSSPLHSESLSRDNQQ